MFGRSIGKYSILLLQCIIVVTMFCLQKVKELTYMHSEGILSGELKHGPLAMIDDKMPVIMIITKDGTHKVTFDYNLLPLTLLLSFRNV